MTSTSTPSSGPLASWAGGRPYRPTIGVADYSDEERRPGLSLL